MPDGSLTTRLAETSVLQRSRSRRWRQFCLAFAIAAATFVLLGFGRTFLLPLLRGSFSAVWYVYAHGIAFLSWITLLIAQATFILKRRVALHRQMGTAGAFLAILMLISGVAVALMSTRRDFPTDPNGTITFFFGQLMDLGSFGVLLASALFAIRRPAWHRRFVLLATLAVIGPAIGRIPMLRAHAFAVTMAFVLAIFIMDWVTNKRPHPATLCGGAFLALELLSQDMIGSTAAWQHLGRSLISLGG